MSSKEKPYSLTPSGGICFTSVRNKNPEIRVDNWIYDLWMPLLGATILGVYTLYCRLDSGDRIWGMTLDDIARVCRLGKKSLMDINATLEDCKFIIVKRPSGVTRLKHFTTEIQVLTPPSEITPDVITKYQHPKGYQPVTLWLVKDEDFPSSIQNFGGNEVSVETTGSSKQNYVEVLHETSKDPCINRSIPLDDPSMHEPENEPTQEELDGWMDGYDLLHAFGVRDEGHLQTFKKLPLKVLKKEIDIVEKSKANDPPGLLIHNLKIEMKRMQARAEREAREAATPKPLEFCPEALQYERPEWITLEEWAYLRFAPNLYGYLHQAVLKPDGRIDCNHDDVTAQFYDRFGWVVMYFKAVCDITGEVYAVPQ